MNNFTVMYCLLQKMGNRVDPQSLFTLQSQLCCVDQSAKSVQSLLLRYKTDWHFTLNMLPIFLNPEPKQDLEILLFHLFSLSNFVFSLADLKAKPFKAKISVCPG